MCGRNTNPGKVAIPGGGGSTLSSSPRKSEDQRFRGDDGVSAACRPACPSTSCRAKSLPRRHGRPPGQAAGPPDGQVWRRPSQDDRENVPPPERSDCPQEWISHEHGEGHGDHGEQFECACASQIDSPWSSVALARPPCSKFLRPFEGTGRSPDCPAASTPSLLAWHERNALRRSHAASGCQAHLRGKNVIPLMAAERARRGKPTTSAASSFGSNA